MELADNIYSELSTVGLLKKNHFMKTDFARQLTFMSHPTLQFDEKFKCAEHHCWSHGRGPIPLLRGCMDACASTKKRQREKTEEQAEEYRQDCLQQQWQVMTIENLS